MKLALFGTSDGRLIVGEGPFAFSEQPPDHGVAFYRNDFALSEAQPWAIPSQVREMAEGEMIGDASRNPPTVHWTEPEVDPFAEVFGEVSQAIRAGVIEKSVPVATAAGPLLSGDPHTLLGALASAPAALRPYAWIDGTEGFVGLSPEHLLCLREKTLSTMALAGTARTEEREAFAVDEKEIREHEFVAQTLRAKLSDLGVTTRHPREILDLGSLVHFLSRITVELHQEEAIDRLIRVLHPTPALGPLPRTDESLAQLLEWRARLGCPPVFGAPFGYWEDGVFEALVAIRMVVWHGPKLAIPSGCGVIEESRLVNEWRELRLKREAVRTLFEI